MAVKSGKLRRYFDWRNLTDISGFIFGIFQSLIIVYGFKPDVVFCKGGYASLPVAIAAWLLRRKIIAHESDSMIGLANRFSARFARKVATGFPIEIYPEKLRAKMVFTGNPVRDEFFKLVKKPKKAILGLDAKMPTILITGGSQGARAVNNAVFEGLTKILNRYQLIHQIGSLDYQTGKDRLETLPEKLKRRYQIFEFASDLPRLMHFADLVVARAGANTLAELAILGKPSILIPLPGSAADHQRRNALTLKGVGAIIFLDQAELDGGSLLAQIKKILTDKKLSKDLSISISRLAKPKAAERISELILSQK